MIRKVYNSPMSGTNSDVAGILSAMSNIKTENASSTVMPRVIFSPESGGSQNPSRLRILSHRQGNIMLKQVVQCSSPHEDGKCDVRVRFNAALVMPLISLHTDA